MKNMRTLFLPEARSDPSLCLLREQSRQKLTKPVSEQNVLQIMPKTKRDPDWKQNQTRP